MKRKQAKWAVHAVVDSEEAPTGFNCHTHGFEKQFSHPNVQIVAPVELELAGQLMYACANYIENNGKIIPGKLYPKMFNFLVDKDFEEPVDVTFAEAIEGGRKVLRLILPDYRGDLCVDTMESPQNKQWIGCIYPKQRRLHFQTGKYLSK